MMKLPFKQVDVFTRVPFRGNPVAVVLEANTLSTEEMQRIATWTNLSETTFVLPATKDEADYRVRIFTPVAELPFAGHPTIGTAHALLEAGIVDQRARLVQECPAGLIELDLTRDEADERVISFRLPPATTTPLSDAQVESLSRALGTRAVHEARPRLIDVGPRWVVVQLPTADDVISARPDMERLKAFDEALQSTGVVIFGSRSHGSRAVVELRAFAPLQGVPEDPVCGSGTGCMGVFIRETGQSKRFGTQFIAAQGRVVGRDGLLRVGVRDDSISVGGSAVTCIDGALAA